MKDEEGNTLKSYDNHEGFMALPRNSVECAIYHQLQTEPVGPTRSRLVDEAFRLHYPR